MTDRARELLERAFRRLDDRLHDDVKLREEIRAYLANDELKTSQEEENYKRQQEKMQWLKDQNQACNWRNS